MVEFLRLLPPEWLPAIGMTAVIAFAAVKLVPVMTSAIESREARHERESKARIEVEAKREERKSQEELAREQRDRERSQAEGRWLAQYEHATKVQEQTNTIMEGVRQQMSIMNAAMTDSKDRSREMAGKVDRIYDEVRGKKK